VANPLQLLNSAQNIVAPAANKAPAAATNSAEVFGVKLIGATPDNLHKLLLSLAFIAVALLASWAIRSFLQLLAGSRSGTRFQFWAKQGVSLIVAAILVLGIMSIWFDSPARLAGVIGLIGAGVAFALQRVITAVAGYFVILRGKTFNVGDRIVMGGVRGDVINLSFMQTQIMEMGQPPSVENGADPAMWVKSRQFTGRIVTVTNDKIFDEPVYNYTHEFPYIWDEISLPVRYSDDRAEAERILLESTHKHALCCATLGEEEAERLHERFGIDLGELDPRIFWRLTDNWLEMTVRFLVRDHGVRIIKDKISRDVLPALDKAEIGIASATYEIVGVPPLTIDQRGEAKA
jgi:small-conductance mechanosensitive channel